MKKSALVSLVLLVLSFAAQSQTKSKQDLAPPVNTAPCAFNYSSGASNTYFRFCVTSTGNIPEIETPQGHFQMGANRHEGYGI